jgi:hypothetical protein
MILDYKTHMIKFPAYGKDMSGREHANYYDFITTYYNEALTAYSDIFDFNLTPGIDGKELWVTEWNVNVGRGASDREICLFERLHARIY